MPKVTVLISAYNTDLFIAKAIESILAQTMGDFELLIVDDGSTDETLSVIRRYDDPRIKVVAQENTGKATAINKLLDISNGEFITIQDADDWSAPERLEKLVRQFELQPELGMVFSGYALVLNDKVCAPRRSSGDTARCKRDIDNYIMPGLDPTMMVRADLAKATKFDPTLKLGEGLDFILKIGEEHPIIQIPDILYYYRFHYQSITKTDPTSKGRYLLQVANSARERRGVPTMEESVYFERTKEYINDANNNLVGHFTDAAYCSVANGYRREAIQTALLSMKYAPNGGVKYLKPLVYSLLPYSWAKLLRKN